MEECFRERIDKVFGSLSSTCASSSSLSSLWCLAEEDIDRNERSGDKEVFGPDILSPETEPDDLSVDGEEERSIVSQKPEDYNDEEWEIKSSIGMDSTLDIEEDEDDKVAVGDKEYDYNDSGDEGRSGVLQKPNDYNDEEWEIKSSIGMDSTLDMEEEEDEDDKVAVGDKDYDYTENVNDYDTEEDEWEELPASFKEIEKDPRVIHLAAKLRVKEDAEAVHKLNSLHVSEVHENTNENALFMSEELHVGFADDSCLKLILKRKEYQADYKLEKRVRFGSDIRDDKDSLMETNSPNKHKVEPDYMQNPSKYIRYTIDSDEIDEVSNRKAYLDFLNMVRSRDAPVVDPLMELPKSVAFVPKRKPMAESKVDNMDKGYERGKGAIAVDTIEDCTVSAIEEDGHDTALNVVRKHSRQYRIRAKEDEEEL